MAQQQQHPLVANLAAIVGMNNSGVILFDAQDYNAALDRLTHALRCSKTMIQSLPTVPSSTGGANSSRPNLSIDDWMRDAPSSQSIYDACGHFVYNHAIVIPEAGYLQQAAAQMSQGNTEDDNESRLIEVVGEWLNLSCAAIIFNLSLTYQAIAVKTSKRNVALKALKLFEHAAGLQSNHQQQETESSGSSMFVLATLNNVGFLHRLLGNAEQSDAFSYKILSILMYMVVGGGDTSQYKDFFKNLTPLIHPTCAECAGAA